MIAQSKHGLVSVVVASYNHAEFLEQRMESLIRQTYQDIEIIVIEDCSTDNSLEVLRKYETNPKVKLIVRENNGGWVAVSNQGIEMSSGEFIIFANCDDDCDPRMIERLVEGMKTNPTAGISFCRSLLVDEQNRVIGDDYAIREPAFRVRCANDTLLTKKEMSRFLLCSCVIPNLSAALIKKECFARLGNLTSAYRACSDWDLFFRIVTRYDVAYVSEPLNKFRQHSTTIRSATKGRVTYTEFFQLLLGQIRTLDLTVAEKIRYRTHVMFLWCRHLFSPSDHGWRNFSYHVRIIYHADAPALAFLGFAIVIGIMKLQVKLLNKLSPVKISS